MRTLRLDTFFTMENMSLHVISKLNSVRANDEGGLDVDIDDRIDMRELLNHLSATRGVSSIQRNTNTQDQFIRIVATLEEQQAAFIEAPIEAPDITPYLEPVGDIIPDDNAHHSPQVPPLQVQEDQTIAAAELMRNNVTSLAKIVADANVKLQKIMVEASIEQRKINDAMAGMQSDAAVRQLLDSIELTRQIEWVESANICKDEDGKQCISVETRPLETVELSDGIRRLIGSMSIRISGDAFIHGMTNTSPLSVINKDRKIDDIYDAPHVYNGKICLGNGLSPMISAFASRDINIVIEIIKKVICEPATTDAYGVKAFKFPRVEA